MSDKPALRERIAKMRGEGMTLQAIADALNDEGVPTLRGGPSGGRRACRPPRVQAPSRNRRLASLPLGQWRRIENGHVGRADKGLFRNALGSVQRMG